MSLVERQQQFLEAAQKHFGTSKAVRPRELFGVSNSAKIVEGGIQLGVVNLDNVKGDTEALILGCVLRFPPEDEVYFAVLVRKDKANFLERLAEMKRLGVAAKSAGEDTEFALEAAGESEAPSEPPGATIKYSARNNLVPIYLARDGRLWLRNSKFWDSLAFDLSPFGPSTEPDEIVVALYPPTASARRSLLAREFIGWLGSLVGREKIHELLVWTDTATLSPDMLRMPPTLPIEEIEKAIKTLGGHYPNGEVRRFHAALNFLDHKHFVILSGLSGTGKTQLALKYARAVHGLTSNTTADPLLFECPVRPEWTDPTGLTGYYDVLTNRYVVPTFLEAVLVATAHRNSPVFVILDEMNLARIEYYLSDILSAIETQGALQLHSNGVPLEGTTGASVRAEIPLPSNLFIIGTINIDETTNPVSDKVLDRASVIDMSAVDVSGFMASLTERYPELQNAKDASEPKLTEIHRLLEQYGLGFGYRVIEEFVRYHAFDAKHLQNSADSVTDQLLVQKVLVKLRGSERQRPLLNALDKACNSLPSAQKYVHRLLSDLDEFGSFQAMR
ncbi:McrB family protein [Pseudomonas frederiksbergensis]|jgi:MoxR-like ATPase|uniref:McrB family protein n=1 Tax=Pseudomonas frederiksbergensis TaxID=104087 RepID=UPI003D19463C